MTDPTKAVHGRKTLVEEGTHFKGSLTSNCPIEVKGRVEGDLTAPALSVSATGAVHGRVKVGEIYSYGELAGEFDAELVQLSGTVKDNTVIRAKSLEVKLTPADGKMQVIFGECSLEVGSPLASAEAKPEVSTAIAQRPSELPLKAPPPPAPSAPSVRPPVDTNGT